MTTAIIGLGNIGTGVARNLAAGGHEVLLADKHPAKAQDLAQELSGKAGMLPVPDAIARADVLVLAIYFDAIKQLLAAYRDSLRGKIVIDPSNPIAPDGRGGFVKTIPAEQSSGQIVAGLLPPDTAFVKAFGTLSAGSLSSGSNRKPERAVLFYATDSHAAGETVAELITASGFAPVRVGGVDQCIRIEVGGDLHELGRLGKLVSVEEASRLI
jgi:predicted dinucleotide-binding enzyme